MSESPKKSWYAISFLIALFICNNTLENYCQEMKSVQISAGSMSRWKAPVPKLLAFGVSIIQKRHPSNMKICKNDKNRRLSRKRYQIGPWLLWITNRKSGVPGRSVWVPVTLNELERRDARGQIFGGAPSITLPQFDTE